MKNFILCLIAMATASMSLLAQPAILEPPNGQVLAAGGTLTLTVTAGGTAPLRYQWFKESSRLLSATNRTLAITDAGVTNSGTYYVVVTNGSGMIISLPVAVAVGSPSLLAWGNNALGKLGNGTTITTNRPITVASNVVAGSAGGGHSLFVTADGTLWAMGDNHYGQLGLGTSDSSPHSTPLSVASNVAAAAAGAGFSLFVTMDGTLWAMGKNRYGELGNGATSATAPNATPMSVASNVVAVAAGFYHALFVKSDGTLWAMGYNTDGELGDGTTNHAQTPISVASNVVAVAAGAGHSLFLKTDATLWAMGNNWYGQLGTATCLSTNFPINVASNVVAIAAGDLHSLFVKTDGTLWTMGGNSFGQLGNGSTSDTNQPVVVASNVVAVAAGYRHSLFIKNDGTLWVMGDNSYGELGNGTTGNLYLPANLPRLCMASVFPANEANYSLASGVIRPPTIANFSASSTNPQQLKLQLTGTPNYPYILQTAANLAPPINWQSIFTNSADTNGNWNFTVSNLTAVPWRFYRAVGQ